MSVDASAVEQPGANAATPPPAVPDLAGWVATQAQQAIAKTVEDGVAQIGQQAADTAKAALADEIAALHKRIGAVEDAAANTATGLIPQAGTLLMQAAAGAEASAAHDVWIPRVIVGGCAAAALAILIGYEAGSHQAADIVAYIAPLLVVIFGLASRMLLAFFTGNAKPPAV